ncbi:Pollen Ole e 1 allergen and extensin family protein [Striga hermonthica]|uniref:Pollen Ole e 1 allergen and extensin family protein n=1 Tax=Striga hermonthica TaxID=68872 RepID=A0A9N7NPJ7_STRHE|nr:Pollen Ole e 1 allergen and extensin family protein [Striga hermonthica]
MALKSVIVVSLLLACIAMPLAEAQLLGGLLQPLFGLLRVQGIVYCTPNGNIGVNGTSTPVFPNASVQLQCGGNVVSTATTNGSGVFSILLDPISFVLSTLLSGCRVAVNTPLASCNTNLPSVGGLISNLQFIGNTLVGLLNIGNIIPSGFQFNANMN